MKKLGIMILTHSGRTTDPNLCSKNYFLERYSDPERLTKLPPFEQLPSAAEFDTYDSGLSFFLVYQNNSDKILFKQIARIKNNRGKIQHAVLLNENKMVVGYESLIELWDLKTSLSNSNGFSADNIHVVKTYNHPYFAGIHTVFPYKNGKIAISASAPDSVLLLDLESGAVDTTLRMPEELYGFNYELTSDMDVRKHYIHNDCQTTHINCAYPLNADGSKIIVSTLIQGAIGIFDVQSGSYRELTRGFIGCHGVKVNANNEIYFADSVNGSLVVIDSQGKEVFRFTINSLWLHDVQHIHGDVYAFSAADANELLLYDTKKEELLAKKKFLFNPIEDRPRLWFLNKIFRKVPFWLGNSTQLISYHRKNFNETL